MSANAVPIQVERIREVLDECVHGLLKGKVILISGGNKGVGAALAIECVKQGAKVAIGARNAEYANHVITEAKEKGYDITFIPTDLKKMADIKNMVDTTVRHTDE
jgi:NAD(P)-dependent dehydrogenase (short-subunit alcohol dehydrogenase family)